MSSINGLGNTLNSINQSLLAEIGSDLSTSSPTASSLAPTGSDQVNLSQVGQLFQQLSQLQSSNPAEFKKIATDAANQLNAAAQQATDPGQAAFLSNLAATFQKSADAGNLSPFQQQAQTASGHHHHHHHHGGDADQFATGASLPNAASHNCPIHPDRNRHRVSQTGQAPGIAQEKARLAPLRGTSRRSVTRAR